MSLKLLFRRSQSVQKKRRTNRVHTTRRLRFETFEDRRMLSFTPVVIYDTGTSDSRDAVTADFNNDGHLDLAMPDRRDDGAVSVLLGDGQGGFGNATLFDVGGYPWSVAVGDFNEDGKLDLATGTMGDYTPNVLPDISVLMGKGDGAFEPVKSVPTVWAPKSVAVGDFNADGHLDLGVGSSDFSYYSNISVNLGDGAGNFSAPVGSNWIDGILESATAADLNGDGADDLVLGDGQRGNGVHVYLGGNASGYLQPSDVLLYGTVVREVAAGDLNEDGVLDIVTANYNGFSNIYGVSVLLGDGQGGYSAAQGHAPGYSLESVVLGDFTGDGHIDIAFGSVNILRGNGDGTFSAPESFPTLGYELAAGDFNGDGWLDVGGETLDTVAVLLNDGDWSPTLPGDYNRDGIADAADYIVWRKTQGTRLGAYSGADGNGNGVVDGDDHGVWRAHFGQTAPPTISISGPPVEVTEGNIGTTNATFTLTLSKATAADVTVHYETLFIGDGYQYAVAGSDYIAASGEVVIAAGETSATFTVVVIGDRQIESRESFGVQLSAPTNATIWYGFGFGHIHDDEPSIRMEGASMLEGRVNRTTLFIFTVTLSAAYDQPVTTSYRTVDGTATTSDNDYVAQTGTLSFAPGETTKTITIEVKGDNKQEDSEYFTLELFDNSANSTIAYSFSPFGWILNDD